MEKFTQEELLQQREEIISLLRSTKRDGIERLIKFLDKKPLCSVWTERFFQSPHGVKAAITVSAETNLFDEFQSP